MRESGWRWLGAALAALGFTFLIGGLASYAGNYQENEAVLVVFGGIFIVIGAGLFLITLLEKDRTEASK